MCIRDRAKKAAFDTAKLHIRVNNKDPFHKNSTPVSYTHLDVYKRQLWAWAFSRSSFSGGRGRTLISMTRRCSTRAVSYTHLDVYKRQL